MQEDRLYDSDIIKPETEDSRFRELYCYTQPWSTKVTGYAWFLDSGKWYDYDNVPMKDIPIIIKNKSGMVFRSSFDGGNFFIITTITSSKVRRTNVVWKYVK